MTLSNDFRGKRSAAAESFTEKLLLIPPLKVVSAAFLLILLELLILLIADPVFYRDSGEYYACVKAFELGAWERAFPPHLPVLYTVFSGILTWIGVPVIRALLLVSGLFTALTVFPLYGWLHTMLSEKKAAWGVFLYALFPEIIRCGCAPLLDSGRFFFFTFLLWLIFADWKNRSSLLKIFLLGIGCGCLILVRAEGICFVVMLMAVYCMILYRQSRNVPKSYFPGKFCRFVLLPLLIAGALCSPRMIQMQKICGFPGIDRRQTEGIRSFCVVFVPSLARSTVAAPRQTSPAAPAVAVRPAAVTPSPAVTSAARIPVPAAVTPAKSVKVTARIPAPSAVTPAKSVKVTAKIPAPSAVVPAKTVTASKVLPTAVIPVKTVKIPAKKAVEKKISFRGMKELCGLLLWQPRYYSSFFSGLNPWYLPFTLLWIVCLIRRKQLTFYHKLTLLLLFLYCVFHFIVRACAGRYLLMAGVLLIPFTVEGFCLAADRIKRYSSFVWAIVLVLLGIFCIAQFFRSIKNIRDTKTREYRTIQSLFLPGGPLSKGSRSKCESPVVVLFGLDRGLGVYAGVNVIMYGNYPDKLASRVSLAEIMTNGLRGKEVFYWQTKDVPDPVTMDVIVTYRDEWLPEGEWLERVREHHFPGQNRLRVWEVLAENEEDCGEKK